MFDLSPEQKDLQLRARAFAEAELPKRAAEIDDSQSYPWDIVEKLVRAGFVGMTLPGGYGGAGRSYLDTVLVIEEMAKKCAVTARIVVETNMGAIGAIMAYGSEAQKKLAAELVLSGDKPAICMTEPEAGSALTELKTTAETRAGRYVLNGAKHWITGGGVSRLHLIFARVLEKGQDKGIGAFIAIRDEDEGLLIGAREPTMGLRGIPEARIHFRDLVLPEDRLLAPPEGIRRGFAGLMNAYNAQRVGAGTVALGIAVGAYELALAYAKTRRQFGRPICEFQGLQWMLADMAIGLDSARLMLVIVCLRRTENMRGQELVGESGAPEPTLRLRNLIRTPGFALEQGKHLFCHFGARHRLKREGLCPRLTGGGDIDRGRPEGPRRQHFMGAHAETDHEISLVEKAMLRGELQAHPRIDARRETSSFIHHALSRRRAECRHCLPVEPFR